jgi:hypothetical protein
VTIVLPMTYLKPDDLRPRHLLLHPFYIFLQPPTFNIVTSSFSHSTSKHWFQAFLLFPCSFLFLLASALRILLLPCLHYCFFLAPSISDISNRNRPLQNPGSRVFLSLLPSLPSSPPFLSSLPLLPSSPPFLPSPRFSLTPYIYTY